MEALREGDDGVLGDIVGGHERPGGESGEGSGVDDVTFLSGGEHPRDKGLDTVEDSKEVHTKGPVPVRQGFAPDGSAGREDAGVVAQEMNDAERSVSFVGESFKVGRMRDVDALEDGFDAGGLKVSGEIGEGLGFNVGEHETHAFGSETPGHSFSNAAGRPGNDGYFICKILHPVEFIRYSLSARRLALSG